MLDKGIQKELSRFENIKRTIEWAKAVLPADLSGVVDVDIYEDYLSIEIPPDLEALRVLRRGLGPKFHFVRSHVNEVTGSRFIQYAHKTHRDRHLSILLDAQLVSGSCEKRQVGYKQVPIYQVVCTN